MTAAEEKQALKEMSALQDEFYLRAVNIGVHPFIEFGGLMSEYITICRDAYHTGIDFSARSKHTGKSLPMKPYQVDYVNEKLSCIFTGHVVLTKGKS